MNKINNEILKQQVQLQRVITSLLNDTLYPSLNKNRAAIRAILLDAEELISITQVNRINREITKLITESSTKAWATVTEGLQEFNEYELSQLAYSFAAAGYKVKGVDDVHNYVANSLMSLEGKNPVTGTWAEFVDANVSGQADIANNQIKQAFVNGDTIKQAVIRINQATGGIISTRVENLARTGASHYSAMARKAFAEDNSDIIDREYPMVTFDSRLSVTCAGIGAKYGEKGWPVGQSPIGYPPFHFNAVAEGEKITTKRGKVAIESVKVGDCVLTHKNRWRKVLTVMVKPNDSNFVRQVSTNSSGVLRVTDEHPLLVVGKGWKRADEIKIGDELFQDVPEVSKLCSRSSVVERNSNYYPSLFDSEEVFFQVSRRPGSMASSINFNSDFILVDSEIENPKVAKCGLVRKHSIKTGLLKVINKKLLTKRNVSSVPVNMPKNAIMRVGYRWVVGFHSFRVLSKKIAIFLIEAVRPVVFSNANPLSYFNFSSYFRGLASGHWFNVVNSTPSAHCSVGKRKITLNSSKSHAVFKVVNLHKTLKKLFLSKVGLGHNISPVVVCDTSIVACGGKLYNLEVEEDNSYLINDVVAHNCRTTIALRLKGEKESPVNDVNEWLESQPEEFQDDVLGKTKADAFRDGVPLKNFTDMTQRPLTIEELKNRGIIKE